MEAHRIVRRRSSHIFYKICSEMTVRLSALRAGRALPPGIFLVHIYIRGWVNARTTVRLEGSGNPKKIQWPKNKFQNMRISCKGNSDLDWSLSAERASNWLNKERKYYKRNKIVRFVSWYEASSEKLPMWFLHPRNESWEIWDGCKWQENLTNW
jgi:hypothetical protein